MPAGASLCIPEGMLGTVLHNVDVDRDGRVDHVRFTIRNQFLHPDHPLGWIRRLTVAVDGTPADPSDVFVVLRGQWIGAAQIPTIREIWWEMRELAEVHIRHDGGLPAGRHRVEVGFDVSLYAHTPGIDDADRYPRLHQTLAAEMEIAA